MRNNMHDIIFISSITNNIYYEEYDLMIRKDT